MRKSAESGTSGRFASSREQGLALPTVLATIAVLLIIGAAVAAQAKSELKAGKLEQDVSQVQAILTSAMDEASFTAWSDPTFGTDVTRFPDPIEPVPAGYQPCTPESMNPSDLTGPQYCIDYLRRSDTVTVRVGSSNMNCSTRKDCGEIPIRIRYKLKAADTETRQVLGWLFIQFTNTNKNQVRSVRTYFDHKWCRENPNLTANLCG